MSSISVVRRSKRRRVFHPSFSPRNQVIQTNQVVSPTGAAIGIRRPRTFLRRMDNRGSGSVSAF